jgi:tetratricopeptide (TPR) repeat protein
MKCKNFLVILGMLVLVVAFPLASIGQQRRGTNRVEGTIKDPSNRPVYNAYVELYNDIGSLVDRQRSSTQGRFSFKGMGPGRYIIQVKPFGTNLVEETKDIELNNQTTGSDFVMVDFRLRLDRRYAAGTGITGTVFAQEVPDSARRLYNSGIDKLDRDQDKGIADLEEAVRIFPTYFDALSSLGKTYVLSGNFEKGYPHLLKAIDVNQKCADCFYSLGLAFYKLNQMPAAIKAIDAAAALQPQSAVIRLLEGLIYRINGDMPRAEKALLLAKSLFEEPNYEVHWQLSMVYNRTNRNLEAANELEQYLKVKPDVDAAEKKHVRDLIAKLRKSK